MICPNCGREIPKELENEIRLDDKCIWCDADYYWNKMKGKENE